MHGTCYNMASNACLSAVLPLESGSIRTIAWDGRIVPFVRRSTPADLPAPPRHVSPGPQILLVDDDLRFVETFGALLKFEGYSVIVATSYAAALVHVSDHVPDVLITDLQLDGANGWDLARHARRYQPFLPVIVVTAWPYDDAAPDPGPHIPVFLKPFEPEVLLRYLESVCRPAF